MVNSFYFNELVLGGSLTALLYAYKKNLPVLIDVAHIPFALETCPLDWDLRFLGFKRGIEHLKSQVWDRLSFLLSMSGLVLFPNNIQNFRLEENKITIIALDNRKMEVGFNKIIEFDRDVQEDLMVYDWFAVHSGSRHDWEVIPDPSSDLCHLLLFHRSTRPRTRTDVKDVCAVSRVPRRDLKDIEHSNVYTRIKTLKMMKEIGIRGRANGYDKKGRTLHYAIDIEFMYREVFEKYNNKMSVEEVLKFKDIKGTNLWNLTQNLLLAHLTTSPE
tara:strand:- start:6535 stop:7353 length:819 start_codon:yes stop_codon:yes gene_type:complete